MEVEFDNEGYWQMNEKLNIETSTAAAEILSATVLWNTTIW